MMVYIIIKFPGSSFSHSEIKGGRAVLPPTPAPPPKTDVQKKYPE